MDALTDQERKLAITELHDLTEKELQAEAKSFSPYSMGVGPARFNAKQMRTNADKAVNARGDVDRFMQGLRDKQRKAEIKKDNQGRADAMQKALEEGLLEFKYKNEVWKRKTKRSKSFYSE